MKLLKKITGTVLALALGLSVFSGISINAADNVLLTAGGWYETAYVEWTNEDNEALATVEYKLVGESVYSTVDEELVRSLENGNGRVDIPGLTAGNYNIKVTTGNGTEINTVIKVTAHDRSGFAHFNNSGLGAYNDDGTLKSNADVIYVTNENKNSVKYNNYTGIGNILKNASKISKPLAVRIIGTIDTQARDSDGTKTTDINNGVVALNGLTDRASSNDSYFNMLDISSGNNITIEGIGENATIEKWGMAFKSASTNCEVRNLTFQKYPEDACSIEGSNYSTAKYFWFHNNTFNVGENKYDLTEEQDKHEGDGAMDINKCSNVTVSYNQFNGCHKTSLNGGGDSVHQYHITYQHNFFNGASSRLPLTRHADVHSYNNYFLNIGNACIDARASACVLSEGNYFENSKNTYRTTENTAEGNPVIKIVGDFVSSNSRYTETPLILTALNRNESYSISENKNPYANFDTNANVFYYNAGSGTSDVMYLTSAQQAKEDALKYSGTIKNNGEVLNITDVPDYNESTTETTTELTTVTTEATTETTTESTTVTTEVTTETTTESTTVTTETTTEATTSEPVYGDANNDGVVEIQDVNNLLIYTLNGTKTKMMNEVSDYIKYLDVNGDNEINSDDVAMVLQKVLDKSYNFNK